MYFLALLNKYFHSPWSRCNDIISTYRGEWDHLVSSDLRNSSQLLRLNWGKLCLAGLCSAWPLQLPILAGKPNNGSLVPPKPGSEDQGHHWWGSKELNDVSGCYYKKSKFWILCSFNRPIRPWWIHVIPHWWSSTVMIKCKLHHNFIALHLVVFWCCMIPYDLLLGSGMAKHCSAVTDWKQAFWLHK
jgi:hypothetical protein